MIKLCNLSNLDSDLARINHDSLELENFLKAHSLDGLELLLYGNWQEEIIPRSLIKGVHLLYWPVWLDFWHLEKERLLEYFGTWEEVCSCYGGSEPEVLLDNYRQQFAAAEAMEAEYMVFHVSDADLRVILGEKSSYSDEEIVDYSIEFLNLVLPKNSHKVKLLMENLWLGGLSFLKPHLADKLLSKINYPNLGFMLDTGHLMNTNPRLRTEKEAIDYIIEVINKLGDNKAYIQGMHLQKSLSGAFREKMQSKIMSKEEEMAYLFQIDQHRPFATDEVMRLIEFMEPKHITYEFITESKEQWSAYIKQQNRALGIE